MRALVTGASGFVGSHLVEHLISMGDEVLGGVWGDGTAIDCDTVSLDITNPKSCSKIIQQFQPDCIYHLAGIASPPAVAADFSPALTVNVGGVHSLLSAATTISKPPHILVVSSGEVYGKVANNVDLNRNGVLLTEELRPEPWNEYALSKLMAEEVVALFAERNNLPIVIARPFNHTGARQSESFVVSAFARQLAMIELGLQDPIMKVGNLNACRDFSDVRDVVRAYRLLVETKRVGLFNVASGQSISIREILEKLLLHSNLDVQVEQDPSKMRGPEIPVLVGCSNRLRQATGWVPQFRIEETLSLVYNWWLEKLNYHRILVI